MRRSVSLCLFILYVTAVTACKTVSQAKSNVKFIGGDKAVEGQFPATIMLGRISCGAVKVGPKHFLTAGHCVSDRLNRFSDGQQFPIDYGFKSSVMQHLTLTLRKVTVHPLYADFIDKNGAKAVPKSVPDFAVIEMHEDTEDIPKAEIEFRPMTTSDRVIISGYGCESDHLNKGPDDEGIEYMRLKYATFDIEKIEESYLQLGRYDIHGKQARVCPGDSGTPVYSKIDGALKVVGVNSFRAIPGREGVGDDKAVWSALARLDGSATGDPEAWLKSVIGQTGGGRGASPRPQQRPQPQPNRQPAAQPGQPGNISIGRRPDDDTPRSSRSSGNQLAQVIDGDHQIILHQKSGDLCFTTFGMSQKSRYIVKATANDSIDTAKLRDALSQPVSEDVRQILRVLVVKSRREGSEYTPLIIDVYFNSSSYSGDVYRLGLCQ